MQLLDIRSATQAVGVVEDEQLVLSALGGDNAAFGSLVRTYYGRVLAFCQTRVRVEADAEDATQETFIRAHRELRRGRLQDSTRFCAWLQGIARHVCIDIIRRVTRRHSLEEKAAVNPTDHARGPMSLVEADEERTQLLATIETLPDECREVVYLHYFNQMTYDEMANWLGVARATVNERLRKGRSLLRQRLTRGVTPSA